MYYFSRWICSYQFIFIWRIFAEKKIKIVYFIALKAIIGSWYCYLNVDH